MKARMDSSQLVIRQDRTANFPGIDHGNGTAPIRVVAGRQHPVRDDLLALKFPGGKCWAGIAMDRTTVHATFRVFRVLRDATPVRNTREVHLDVVQVLEWPVSAPRAEKPARETPDQRTVRETLRGGKLSL